MDGFTEHASWSAVHVTIPAHERRRQYEHRNSIAENFDLHGVVGVQKGLLLASRVGCMIRSLRLTNYAVLRVCGRRELRSAAGVGQWVKLFESNINED